MPDLLDYWQPLLAIIGLIIVLAKMHANQEVMKEKIKVLFELWNRRDKDGNWRRPPQKACLHLWWLFGCGLWLHIGWEMWWLYVWELLILRKNKLSHLKDVNLSWDRHLRFAWRIAWKLLLLSLTALFHGIFPFIWVHSVSDSVIKMADELHKERMEKHPHWCRSEQQWCVSRNWSGISPAYFAASTGRLPSAWGRTISS